MCPGGSSICSSPDHRRDGFRRGGLYVTYSNALRCRWTGDRHNGTSLELRLMDKCPGGDRITSLGGIREAVVQFTGALPPHDTGLWLGAVWLCDGGR